MNKINVLHLRSSGGFAGAEKVILSLAKESQTSNSSNYIACIDNKNNSHTELLEKAKVAGLDSINIRSSSRFDLEVVNKLAELLKEKKISILHTHGYKEDVLGYFAARKLSIVKIATVHGWTGHNLKVRLYELLDKFILRFFDKVIVVSETIKGKLIKLGVPEDKIVVINNGIDLQDFSVNDEDGEKLKKELEIKDGEKVIGTIGRLSKEKGHRYLLEALKLILPGYPKLKLVIVGDGAEKDNLLSLADKLGIKDKVLFTGHRDDVKHYYQVFDFFVLPSITEGLPLTLLEALAMCKPVIANRVGGIPEVIESGKNGISVPPGNAELLAEAILELLKNKPQADLLAEKGREVVEKNFSSTIMAQKYMKIYKELTEVKI